MKVSVAILTYNHEQYIAKALDSILMQQTYFGYEIVIGEDCSTDNTRDILIDYQKKHPDKIRLILNEQNIGAMANDKQVHQACQGEYVAWLEGDDYWTSPHKLQKQVDFLDNHPECSSCFHAVTVFYEDNSQSEYISPDSKDARELFLEDLLEYTAIYICAFMHRNIIFNSLPDFYYTSRISDYVFYLVAAQQGSIGYINEVMGAYRVHPGGIWSGRDNVMKLQSKIETFKNANAYLDFKYNKFYKQLISACYQGLAIEYANMDNLFEAKAYFLKSLAEYFLNRRASRKNYLIKIPLRLYAPRLYKLMKFKLIPDHSLL
jgi:glycosyltransferase involved in cell wall biosynthesis